MKIFLFYAIIYLLKYVVTQKVSYKNNEEPNRKLNTMEKDSEGENADNPLVFNALFKDLKEEWTRTMSDFVNQYIYLIPVPYNSQADLYENITRVPSKMRGAFLLEEANSKNDKIEFKIIAPNNTVIFSSNSYGAIFSLELMDKGLYTILFNNRNLRKEVKPTLIMNSGQNLILEKERLTNTERNIDALQRFVQKYEENYKLNRGFRKRGNEELTGTNKYFFLFSFFETLVLIGVSFWQYYYLKHLFEVKGSL